MVFSSLPFILGFLPIFFIVYYIIPYRFKNIWILIGSLAFYAYGTKDLPLHFVLLCVSIIINTRLGRAIDRHPQHRKRWLIVGLAYNFGCLFIFKYSAFFLNNIGHIFGADWSIKPLTLPLGISFFTFQITSYLIDVYRRVFPAERSCITVGTYISMYPQLIAGPIVTYSSVREQMKHRQHSYHMFDVGLREFCIGLGLKVLLANQIGNLWSDVSAIGFESISTPLAWMGIAAYSFQIYFDFYGYSRMAIGLGLMMGIRFPHNFHYPYTTRSMTDFWRRWHITLGSWFREYVYIPLGGNRKGKLLTVRNMLIVWLFTGLWHGASWNFILWGLILFVLLMIEKAGLKKLLDRFPLIGHLYMCLVIPLTWLIFAVTDLSQIGIYLERLFPFLGGTSEFIYALDYVKYGKTYGVLLLVCLLFCTPIPRRIYKQLSKSIIGTILVLAIFIASLYCLYIGLNDPFLYFRF
jgi:alginate O-acetyltransferase complex protein AlgI